MFKFPVSQPLYKPEQLKLLPGRKPIIQIAERPIPSKTRSKVSTPENSGLHHKVIPIPDYTIPQTMPELDSTSRAIRRKGMQDVRREIPAYADAIYRPPPKPAENYKTYGLRH